MAAGLGAESLAAKFKQGGALGSYRGKWLLLSAANVKAEVRLAKKYMGSHSSGLSWAARR